MKFCLKVILRYPPIFNLGNTKHISEDNNNSLVCTRFLLANVNTHTHELLLFRQWKLLIAEQQQSRK